MPKTITVPERRLAYDETNQAEVAQAAVVCLGGPSKAAEKISELSSRQCNPSQVSKWQENGVPARFCPVVHQLTQLPLHHLNPEVYPAYLFGE